MVYRIVVTGLEQLPPTERWSRLVAPLADELANSGLGRLPHFASLRDEAVQSGGIATEEIAVELVNQNYGQPLIDRVLAAAGIQRGVPKTPAQWQLAYHCDDYFSSGLAQHGYFDEPDQFFYIFPVEQVYEDTEKQFLIVGSPGVDGIDWGYRQGVSGLWAWYPIEAEFVFMAATVQELLDGWLSGTISV